MANSGKKSGIFRCCKVCGTEFYVFPSRIAGKNIKLYCSRKCQHASLKTYWRGKKKPAEQAKNIRLAKTGKRNPMFGRIREDSPSWRGGKKRIYKAGSCMPEYNNWRISVFNRDNYTCQNCGAVKTYLQAHHIKSFCNFPELRLDVNNGLTLCRACHYKTENFGRKAQYQEA